eukprot:Gregarina_sp_Poly_1__10457@NODE_75_length_15886_cov_79_326569_g64_i0_p10_GENE_NODE_75_length_15886_cov_79_326569_g64_i0NODE_75_length_15886_cov_79_326569_g64_i0_p10_ORF_typecomplete_len100_score7_98Folliculin_C/PF16692_5/0_014_NODE_75_length_15886_cov_79_326569_g64_i01029710596
MSSVDIAMSRIFFSRWHQRVSTCSVEVVTDRDATPVRRCKNMLLNAARCAKYTAGISYSEPNTESSPSLGDKVVDAALVNLSNRWLEHSRDEALVVGPT